MSLKNLRQFSFSDNDQAFLKGALILSMTVSIVSLASGQQLGPGYK
jgi:hypothetical protein